MTHAIDPRHRDEQELTPVERARLEEAHRELSRAVATYETKFIDGPLAPSEDVPIHGADAIAAAQARIDTAEQNLWRVREELLGWKRPSWAQRAADVTDWFSDEDRVYDTVDDSPGQAR